MASSLVQSLRQLLGLRVVVGRAGGHVFFTRSERGGEDAGFIEKRFVELDPNVFKSPVDIVDVNTRAPIPATWHNWLLGGDLPDSEADDIDRTAVVGTVDDRRPRNSPPSKKQEGSTPTVPLV